VIARPIRSPTSDEWRLESAQLGMWVFLVSEVMFLGALFLGYLHGRMHDGHGFAEASRHTQLALGTLNTAILLTSSFTMALAVRSAALGARLAAARFLWTTASFGVAFIAIKLYEYSLEWRDGLVPGLRFRYDGEAANAVAEFFILYFVMTGIHALHLAIGIGAVAWNALQVTRPAAGSRECAIDVIGLYWHFVDAVWIFLYPMIYLLERWR
jgi:cytochrome c oxidase subunit 3